MSNEAEKLINLSLCKMTSPRSYRAGGSVLHKHLLIASVLTKARSAYFDTWPGSRPGTTTSVEPISSYNNKKVMEDEDDVDVVDHDENDEDVPVIDPRVFVQVESEIELPADILNCVEKLGSLGGVDFFHNNLSASVDDVEIQDFAEKGEQVVVERAENGVKISSLEGENRLRNLLSSSSQERAGLSSEVEAEGKNNNHHNQQQENHRPSSVTMPNKSSDKSFYGLRSANTASQHEDNTTINYNRSNFKRRRGSDSHSTNPDHHENLSDSATDVSVSNLAKRLRISNAANVIQESSSRTTFNNNNNNNIINKEQQGWEAAESAASESMKHDRRVPSNPSPTPASSPTKKTNNSSDEENDQPDSMMEVDQITSLVQYFSFSQQQHSSSNNDSSKSSNPSSASSPPRLGAGSSSSSSTSSSSSNLIRSVSSPDLCSSNHRCVVVTT